MYGQRRTQWVVDKRSAPRQEITVAEHTPMHGSLLATTVLRKLLFCLLFVLFKVPYKRGQKFHFEIFVPKINKWIMKRYSN